MDAFNLGKTIRMLAVLDGGLLLLNCAYVPMFFLLLLWVRLLVQTSPSPLGVVARGAGGLLAISLSPSTSPTQPRAETLLFRRQRT